MKFLLELVACCGSCSGTSMVKEEAILLVGSVPPPSPPSKVCGNKGRNRKRGRSSVPNGGGSVGDWRPSLSSICEENVLNERPTNERSHHRHHQHHEEVAVARSSSSSSSSSSERNLKRKITSTPRPRSRSSREDVNRRPAIHAVMPAFSPAPFML